MKISALALAAALIAGLAGPTFAAPLSNLSDIGDTTLVRIINTAQTAGIEGSRAAGIAGSAVTELKFVGKPTNPWLEGELNDDGYEMADLVKLYSDVDGIVWAFVAPAEEEEEEPRRRIRIPVARD